MSFLFFCNTNIIFINLQLTQRFYIIAKTLLIINLVKNINREEFVKLLQDKNVKIFVYYAINLKKDK